jgi:endoglucanase
VLRDPSNKLIIEMHQYFDNAGGKPELASVTVGMGASSLEEATRWARARYRKLFLGEFGVTADPAYLEEGRALLRYLSANSDVWIGYAYWSGGLWWAEGRSSYGFSIEPGNLDEPTDRPQMLMLREFL